MSIVKNKITKAFLSLLITLSLFSGTGRGITEINAANFTIRKTWETGLRSDSAFSKFFAASNGWQDTTTPTVLWGQPLNNTIKGKAATRITITSISGNADSIELFTSNGHRTYCFDFSSSATGNRINLGDDLSSLGLSNETLTLQVANMARVLTENNFKLLRDNADTIVKSSLPSGLGMSKAYATNALTSNTANGRDFKQVLVQFFVWNQLGQMKVNGHVQEACSAQYFGGKEGVGECLASGDAYGIGLIYDFSKIKSIANAAIKAEAKASSGFAWQNEYEIAPGETITLSGQEGIYVWDIYKANGYFGTNNGDLTVKRSGGKTTITASKKAKTAEYDWQSHGVLEASRVTGNAKPYQDNADSGQLCVEVEAMGVIRAKIKVQRLIDLELTKNSLNPQISEDNAMYSLEGAEYTFYYDSECTQPWVSLTTDANGKASKKDVPIQGDQMTVYAKETKRPLNYKWDYDVKTVRIETPKNANDNEYIIVDFFDEPADDPNFITINKIDKENSNQPRDLSGAEFTFKYYDGIYNTETELPSEPKRTWVFKTIKGGDDFAYIDIQLEECFVQEKSDELYLTNEGEITIPVGTVLIEETKAPEAYKLEEGTLIDAESGKDIAIGLNKTLLKITFNEEENRADIEHPWIESGNKTISSNQVKRVGIRFRKIDSDTQKSMAGIQFKFTDKETGESHILTTDANGAIDSEKFAHTFGINNGGVKDGIWFGDGTEVNNNKGAFRYGVYLVEEIEGPNNAGRILFKDEISLEQEDEYVVDLYTIENRLIKIGTKAKSIDNENVVPAVEGAIIVDTVEVDGTDSEKEYYLVGKLYNADTKELLKDEEGNEITAQSNKFTGSEIKTIEKEMEFEFDGRKLLGNHIVVYEYLYEIGTNGNEDFIVSTHEDPTDESQTVVLPDIKTNASDDLTGEQTGLIRENIVVHDEVKYDNLRKGRTYEIVGTLYKAVFDEEGNVAGEVKVLDAEGNEVTTTEKFKATASSGTLTLTFKYKGEVKPGDRIVAFETLYQRGEEYAVHADINDEPQIIYFPEIGTVAKGDNGSKNVVGKEETKLVDTVKLHNVDPKATYIARGTLYDKTTDTMLEGVEADSGEFVLGSSDGEVDVTFKFDGSELGKHYLVAMEKLYLVKTNPETGEKEEIEVTSHEDKEDEAQTIYVETPEVEKYINKSVHEELETIKEDFTYDIMGFITQDAETVTFEDDLVDVLEFKGEENSVKVVVHDGNDHKVNGTVADEGKLLNDNEFEVTMTENSLKVYLPDVSNYRGKWIKVTFDAKIKDEYKTVDSVKQDNVWEKIDNNKIVLEGETPHEGVANKARYVINVENGGKYYDTNTVTVTPPIPEIKTTALGNNGKKDIIKAKETEIVDTVQYKGLEAGWEYELELRVYNKATKSILKDKDGNEIVVKQKFIPNSGTGSEVVKVTFDGRDLNISDEMVAYEKLYLEGEVVATHEDPNDKNQTVKFAVPTMKTTATDKADGDKKVKAASVTIVDKVEYEDLDTKSDYEMCGVMHLVDGGKDKGKVSNENCVKFTPKSSSGSINVEMKVDATKYAGKKLVAFEELKQITSNGKKLPIASHKDINDKAQTVNVEQKLDTSATRNIMLSTFGLATSVVLLLILFGSKNKKA